MRTRLAVLACLTLLLGTAAAQADTTVELKNVHLCCKQCITAVAKTLKGVEGVKGVCDQKARTVTITAKDARAAQAAVDALLEAGFHGKTDSKDVRISSEKAPEGKVKSLTLEGIHNCCGQCNNIIKKALKK